MRFLKKFLLLTQANRAKAVEVVVVNDMAVGHRRYGWQPVARPYGCQHPVARRYS